MHAYNGGVYGFERMAGLSAICAEEEKVIKQEIHRQIAVSERKDFII